METVVSVAMGVALRCRHRDGRVRRTGYTEAALRAGLLVDLVLAGRLSDVDDGLVIDTDPTGFGPLDTILRAVTGDPTKTLAHWIGMGPPVQLALVKELTARGNLVRSHADGKLLPVKHYIVPRDAPVADVDGVRSSCIDALACLAGESVDDFTRPDEETLGGCGPARWLVAAADEFLTDARLRNDWARSLVQDTSDSGQ